MSRREIMWGESWINIAMMLSDAPYYKTEKSNEVDGEMTDDDIKEFAEQIN